MTSEHMMCCAVNELHGLEGSEDIPKDLIGHLITDYYAPAYVDDWTGQNVEERFTFPAFFIFTQASDGDSEYGEELKELIAEKKLGEVVQIGPRKNPNSGNKVIIYTWAIDPDALEAWVQANRPARKTTRK